jgi:hypothetical protein
MLNDVEPQHRCDKHIDHDDPPPCGACTAQQRVHATWLKAKLAVIEQAERDAELEHRFEEQQRIAAAIAACTFCDETGYSLDSLQVCDHVDHREINRRGSALVRAELDRLAAQRKARQ